jgi:hypothetical protein
MATASAVVVALVMKRSVMEMLRFGAAGILLGTVVYDYARSEGWGAGNVKIATFLAAGYVDVIISLLRQELPKYIRKKYGIPESDLPALPGGHDDPPHAGLGPGHPPALPAIVGGLDGVPPLEEEREEKDSSG